jgi:hypothetical protein
MSRVVDFLERMGSEAHWRGASQHEIEQALEDAGVDAPMCEAILAKDISAVQALLGRVKMTTYQIPSPHEVPQKPEKPQKPQEPEPEKKEDEEEGGDSGESNSSQSACGSPPVSSLSLS